MPRRKAAIKREVLPDPLFKSEQVAKFINVIMREGKKSIAEKIVYSALYSLTDRLKKENKDESGDEGKGGKGGKGGARSAVSASTAGAVRTTAAKDGQNHSQDDVLSSLQKALVAIAPTVEVKSRRVGGATYQVPIEVAPDRGIALAMRWVVDAAKGRSEKTMALRLAAELYDAYLGRGASIKTRDDVHRMAKANQAFAHYRW